MATVKKSAPKKAVKKAIAAPKKAAPKKSATTSKELVVASNKALEETQKVMTDIDIITQAINLLKTVKNTHVQTKLDLVLSQLDDINYIAATGKPRINNLKTKQEACELANSGAYDVSRC